ncbi:hypothetical protein OG225_02680 [Nocardia sp. NBC_01377]|uniref:DUF6414 family protein n=1 Tax=Nocardia sp. NBC_01377 TaxID=2903595 RepID=UPI00324E2FDD
MAPESHSNFPTVVLYQNSDFVSGMLQELQEEGLLEASETSSKRATTDREGTSDAIGTTVDRQNRNASTAVPALIKEQLQSDEIATADRKKFVYSQSFYLDGVRRALRERALIRTLDKLADTEDMPIGAIVQFTAKFAANEVNAILDIATPTLTSEIARYMILKEGTDSLNEIGEHADLSEFAKVRQLSEAKAADRASLVGTLTSALRADFRGDHTKEYYASLDKLTVIVVCETEHFITRDADRLLDGSFTVLAKVISKVEKDVPILARNKLLNRIESGFLDHMLDLLSEAGDKQFAGESSSYSGSILNTDFAATVDGHCLTVMPIAIFV